MDRVTTQNNKDTKAGVSKRQRVEAVQDAAPAETWSCLRSQSDALSPYHASLELASGLLQPASVSPQAACLRAVPTAAAQRPVAFMQAASLVSRHTFVTVRHPPAGGVQHELN